ncbi:MAG: response regulator transcription factor [Dehalococcoidia bacterium]
MNAEINQPSGEENQQKCVLVAHQQTLIRESITKMLSGAGFLVHEVTSIEDSLEGKNLPEHFGIVLLEYPFASFEVATIRKLVEKFPQASLALLISPNQKLDVIPALKAGVKGYLSTNLSSERFLQALNTLEQGMVVLSEEAVEFLQDSEDDPDGSKSRHTILSEREGEVLKLVGVGATNREIAERLIVSEHTVKVHLRSILNKLNLRNRQQIAAYAAQEGMIEEEFFEEGAFPQPVLTHSALVNSNT